MDRTSRIAQLLCDATGRLCPRGLFLIVVGLASIAAPALGQAAVIFVTPTGDNSHDGLSWASAKQTVSAGLAAAASGDQVWVAAGTYFERITLKLEVALYGGFVGVEDPATFNLSDRNFVANNTTLDGNQAGTVVTGPAGATATCRIDGFTIAHGNTLSGGGLYLSSSSPTITNNTIMGNTASNSGGGLWGYNCSPTIVNNTFTGNAANNNGGAADLSYSSATIANNAITNNVASAYGGGMHIAYSSATLANNTITNNGAAAGGGLYLEFNSPTIVNSIIAFNSSGVFRASGTLALRSNCVFGNDAYNYSGLVDPTGISGNISTDPRLANPEYGNLHVQPDSPCVNAGNNADAAGAADIDGQARIQGGLVDIGADESDGTVWASGPSAVVRVSPAGNDTNDGSTWDLAKRTVQAGIDAAAETCADVWVEAGTYYERVTLSSYVHAFGGFIGSELTRDERDWVANVTVLDGQQQGSVVTTRAAVHVSTLDGFMITHGSAAQGGGLYLSLSSPTIANNTITGNSALAGGGLYMDGSCPTITGNTITANTATNQGGGFYLFYSSPTIIGNTVTDNTASSDGGGLFLAVSFATISKNAIAGNAATADGGGLCLSSSSPTIVNNKITDNRSNQGGGIYLSSSSGTIVGNVVSSNRALNSFGAGLYIYASSPAITNNVITQNLSSAGGGLFLSSSSPTITNTIIAFNSSGLGQSGGTPSLRNNCVFGNTVYNYAGLTNPTGTNGNISVNPAFARAPSPGLDLTWGTPDDDDGDLHLSRASSCLDTGDPNFTPPPGAERDLDGHPRILDGNGDSVSRVDMGAYEFAPCPGDANYDRRIDLDDLALLLANFGSNVAPWIGGDVDGNGVVSLGDLALLLSVFGATCP